MAEHSMSFNDDPTAGARSDNLKRSIEPGNEANKRSRAPYTLRACDACRKRKGRCNGENPCDHCISRKIECCFTYPPDDRRFMDRKPLSTEQLDQSSINSLSQLVISMQGQLASLTAQVQASKKTSPQAAASVSSMPYLESPAYSPGDEQTGPEPPITNVTKQNKRFYGPTSPDFSFNVAEAKSSGQRKNSRGRLLSIGEDASDEEDILSPEAMSTPGSLLQPSSSVSLSGLCHFSTLLTRAETIRYINVYRSGIGELHPIYDEERLLSDADAVYSWRYSSKTSAPILPLPDELRLLILNVVICIALCAEAPARAIHGKTIFAMCESFINAKLVGLTIGVHTATLAMLVGIYHFSIGRYPLASRICGIAGRLAMELGLHKQDVSSQYPDEDQAELAALCCSIIVFDRQWNAASGLPPCFQFSDFELATKSVRTPYLKAMMDFTLMSHTFNEPIDKAARGEAIDDDNAFDITTYKVSRWREKALADHDFLHPDQWALTPSARPPAWTIMLYLRANAVKAILLRQLFLSQTPTTATKEKLMPAIELVTETINILAILDEATDIYRVLHSPFEHFLSANSALFFLLMVYIEHNQADLSPDLPQNFVATIRDNFWKALRLAATYSSSFASSRRLWKRLITMRGTLESLGILASEHPPAPPPVKAEEPPGQHQQHHIPSASQSSAAAPSSQVYSGSTPLHASQIPDWYQMTSNAMFTMDMSGMNGISAFDVYGNVSSDGGSAADMGIDFFAMDGGYQPFHYP